MKRFKPVHPIAKHGEKMITVKVRFWSNNIAGGKNRIIKKHVWTGGMISIDANKSHGIGAIKPKAFHSLMDIGAVLERVFLEHNIVLHPSRKMKKYMKE